MRSLSIAKPGIIFGNVVTASGGYFLGSRGHIQLIGLLITLIGMGLIIACGCILNNYIDRDIDKLMERTKNRLSAQGLISGQRLIIYAILTGLLGIIVLWLGTNLLTLFIALIGLFGYVIIYSIWLKRTSTLGTEMGAIAGAVPPVVGYCAATNCFDLGAILVFAILFFWQMPHFYAISIYRLNDYKAASLPILPLKKSMLYTKIRMLIYTIAFVIACILPTLFGYEGYVYFVIALFLGLIWLYLAIQGFKTKDDVKWARKMFLFSIINITLLCIAMGIKY